MMPNLTEMLVKKAARAAQQAAAAPEGAPAGGGTGQGAVGGANGSIQNPDGKLYFMVGISLVGGPDVVAP
jgi:hypothetical protein